VPLLSLNNLTIRFPGAARPAVNDLSLSIDSGEVLGLVGESGSGKSLTALAIMRLLVMQATIAGSITFDGHDLATLPEDDMRSLRGRRIAMIFQEPMIMNP